MMMLMVVIMLAVAMIVIAVAVVMMIMGMVVVVMMFMAVIVMFMIMVVMVFGFLIEVLIRFEQPHTQNQRQRNLGASCANDPRTFFNIANFDFEDIKVGFIDKICLVQQQNVTVGNLVVCSLAIEEIQTVIFGIDDGDDGVKSGQVSQFGAQKREGDGQRIGQSSGFND